MKFSPQKYAFPDLSMQPFIDANEIGNILKNTASSKAAVEEVIDKSLSKQRLSLAEVAILINATDASSIQAIKEGAKTLKKNVYGNRIVLFAPLYIGNKCQNNCSE